MKNMTAFNFHTLYRIFPTNFSINKRLPWDSVWRVTRPLTVFEITLWMHNTARVPGKFYQKTSNCKSISLFMTATINVGRIRDLNRNVLTYICNSKHVAIGNSLTLLAVIAYCNLVVILYNCVAWLRLSVSGRFNV